MTIRMHYNVFTAVSRNPIANKHHLMDKHSIKTCLKYKHIASKLMSLILVTIILLMNWQFSKQLSIFLVLNVASVIFTTTQREGAVPVFFINMDDSVTRRLYINNHLRSLRFKFKRVRAYTEWDVKEETEISNTDVTSVLNIISPNNKEIACIASHLLAIYSAVHDQSLDSSSPYALVVEDDLHLEMRDVNFMELAKNAPDDWTVLQLTTCNGNEVQRLWSSFVKQSSKSSRSLLEIGNNITHNGKQSRYLRSGSEQPSVTHNRLNSDSAAMWERRSWDSVLWSSQAYLVHKERIRPLIDRMVGIDPETSRPHVRILHPLGVDCSHKPCLLPFRVVADLYLYSAFGPTYVTAIPMVTSAMGVGVHSTIRNRGHLSHFQKIRAVLDDVKQRKHLVPQYIIA